MLTRFRNSRYLDLFSRKYQWFFLWAKMDKGNDYEEARAAAAAYSGSHLAGLASLALLGGAIFGVFSFFGLGGR